MTTHQWCTRVVRNVCLYKTGGGQVGLRVEEESFGAVVYRRGRQIRAVVSLRPVRQSPPCINAIVPIVTNNGIYLVKVVCTYICTVGWSKG